MREPAGWNRREFLKVGAVAGAAATVGCAPHALPAAPRPRLRTRLCDLLGIEYPVLQSGMAPVGGPELAAAVSAAGGLGILGVAHVAPEEVRNRIREVRRRTDRPFGANLLLHEQVWPPVDAATFADGTVAAIHAVLNRFRARLGLAPRHDRPPTRPNHVPGAIEVIIEERVPVFSVGLGNPSRELVERFHAQGATVVAMVATVEDARAVAANGVDAIVAQGSDAGGHRSTWTKPPSAQHAAIGTMSLVPEVVAAVDVPVLAAGGVTNGRGIVAALALGADGVLVGTRFIATSEARARDFYKQALVDGRGDTTVVTDAYSGLYARLLRNTYTEEYDASGAPTLPGYAQLGMNGDVLTEALNRADPGYYPLWAGQGVGMVGDVRPAGDVLRDLVREAESALRELQARV
ncbi:MAG TPA: nitronate monooxygenase family protein [Longimicrobiales bacterium]|nr:nitronate monooxygenase family protein [Longimicrobiales bacterium]